MAGISVISAIVRDLTDDQVLEIQCVENLQRDDLHPLEEAAGYQQLVARKYDVSMIAEKIGRSVKYVYDRMKLRQLTPELKELFLADKITAGHAILLARLKPEEQKRCLGEDDYGDRTGGLFIRERTLFHPDHEDGSESEPLKAVSVRELQGWIDEHVKLEAEEVDQMVLPETASTLMQAENLMKVLRITRESITPDELKGGPKVILDRSWERADGQFRSKTCEHSRLAMVVIGAGRGEAFQVCVAKDKCTTHWPNHVKAAKAAARAAASGEKGKASAKKPKVDKWELERQKREEVERREEAERARYRQAMPQILEAVAERAKKMPAGATSTIARIVIDSMTDRAWPELKKRAQLVPAGKSAEDVLRHLAFFLFCGGVGHYFRPEQLIKDARAFGVDAKKIVDQVAPVEKPAAEKKPAKKKAGKK
jgi:hypothetical protein